MILNLTTRQPHGLARVCRVDLVLSCVIASVECQLGESFCTSRDGFHICRLLDLFEFLICSEGLRQFVEVCVAAL